jgi:hypothetical protein
MYLTVSSERPFAFIKLTKDFVSLSDETDKLKGTGMFYFKMNLMILLSLFYEQYLFNFNVDDDGI